MKQEYFIGVDVAKKTLEIAFHKQDQHLGHIKVSNDLKAMKALEKKLKN